MIKIAVVGSRGFNNYSLFSTIMDRLVFKQTEPVCLVSGGAKGADAFAERYAKIHSLEMEVLLPDWDKHGKSAGFKRNYDIWNSSDIGIAFWDGVSKGTSHSFKIAREQKKELFVFDYNENKWFKDF